MGLALERSIITLSRRQTTVPPCVESCLLVTPFGSCASTDTACLCRSVSYVQGVFNCALNLCSSSELRSSEGDLVNLCASVGASIPSGSITIPGSTPSSTAASQTSPGGSSQTSDPSSSGQSNTQGNSSNTGAIAGGVVAGVAVLSLAILAVWLYRRRKSKSTSEVTNASNVPPMGHHSSFPPPMIGGAPHSSNTVAHFQNSTVGPAPSFVNPTVATTPSFVSPTVGTTSFAGLTAVTPPLVPDPRIGGTSPSLHATSPYFSHASRASTYSTPSQPPAEVMEEPAQTDPLLASAYQPSNRTQTPPWTQGVDSRSGPNVSLANNYEVVGDSDLPEYRDDYTAHAAPGAGLSSGAVYEAAQARAYEESISQFCATNRDLISPALEGKLRAARYLPKDNPSEIPAEYWRDSYGVEFFDLKRLQEAYERNLATEAILRKEAATARVKGKA